MKRELWAQIMRPGKNSGGQPYRTPWLRGLAVLACAGLAACNPAGTGILIVGSAISYIETEKTLPDHALSQMLNKDCAGKRLLEEGKFCADEDGRTTTVAAAVPEYCYRTLGDVTCYAHPDPFDPKNDEVAWPNPNGFAANGPQNTGSSVALRDIENKGN